MLSYDSRVDEDAFSWAVERSRDDGAFEARRHIDDALVAAGIVADHVTVANVGDAVLEKNEHFGAVIGAKTVTGAQVLVDPNSHHDVRSGTPG